jgi:L-alanine-DL-glutamate epimerase-like enolase superfamily enzyme
LRVTIRVDEARLRGPHVSSQDSVDVRPLILLALDAGDGLVGYGEAAPLPGYDGVTVDDVLAALEACRPILSRSDQPDPSALRAACQERTLLSQALAAIDLAMFDLTAKRVGQPVWEILSDSGFRQVPVNATIGAVDRAGAATEAAAARAAGFRAIKVKVGVGDDAGRLAAVRAVAGPEMAIRIDANGAWTVDEAIAALRVLAPVGIECCEEPVHGLDEIAAVAASTEVPISIDETAGEPGAFDRRVCSAVCLKIARCGGIVALLADTIRARAAGYQVYVASTLDGPLGIAAAVHAAVAIDPDRPCGLATLSLFEGRADPIAPRDGTIAPPPGDGLGDGLSAWYL